MFALEASPVTPRVLWAGSDDELIHIARDGGEDFVYKPAASYRTTGVTVQDQLARVANRGLRRDAALTSGSILV